jgi:hypothetical protein
VGQETAGPSTSLRSGRDDNSFVIDQRNKCLYTRFARHVEAAVVRAWLH